MERWEIPKVANSGFYIRCLLGLTRLQADSVALLLQSDIVVGTQDQGQCARYDENVATQYRVNEQAVTDAYYELMRPRISDVNLIWKTLLALLFRTIHPWMNCLRKDEIALESNTK